MKATNSVLNSGNLRWCPEKPPENNDEYVLVLQVDLKNTAQIHEASEDTKTCGRNRMSQVNCTWQIFSQISSQPAFSWKLSAKS